MNNFQLLPKSNQRLIILGVTRLEAKIQKILNPPKNRVADAIARRKKAK